MALVAYYVLAVVIAILAWRHTYGARGASRLFWLALGAVAVGLPLLLPAKPAVFYGLLVNVTVFVWASDTHTGREDRRLRGLLGSAAIALLSLLWSRPLGSWAGVFLTASLGALIAAGILSKLAIALSGRHA